MQRVGAFDQFFLWLERRNQPMHVGSLVLLTPPADEGAAHVARIVEWAHRPAAAAPPFDQRLVRRLSGWFWDRDPDFDIEAHVRHLSLPRPGRVRELLTTVSRLHANLMDRAKPLW